MSAAIPADYDPGRAEWRTDPYPHYRRLRDAAPVHFVPGLRAWCVSRYDDVSFVLRHPELFSSRAMFTYLINQGQEGMPRLTWPVLRFLARFVWHTRLNPFEFATARNLISEDGERHAAMRAVVNRGFSPRRIAAWEERARELVAECLAKLRSQPDFDLIEDLAIPLPVTLIAEMLGVEPARRRDFKRWSDVIVDASTGPGRSRPYDRRFTDTVVELATYLRALAEARRREPTGDLISLISAEQDGETALTIREVIQFVMLLLVAGNETTTNLIGNAVTALLDHPDQLRRVADDPSRVPGAIEEALRFDSPVQLVFRNTTEAVELSGVKLPKGAYVVPLIGSANRDERRFADPDRFDVEREAQGHLAFGFGEHFCLGASLARLEARVALEGLLPELVRLERRGKRELVDSFLVRGPRRLELAYSSVPDRKSVATLK
jgi:cytochrome P450